MSWLKLTRKALYLMEGGTENYIDKVEFASVKDGDPLKIKEFPYGWFSSVVTRPKTIIVDKSEPPKSHSSFSDLAFLKLFEIPINRQFYDELKKCRSLDAVLKKFYALMGGFSSDFFKYSMGDQYLLPPSVSSSSDSEYYTDKDLSQSFPEIDFQEPEPDYYREEPSFDEIFLPLIWRNKVTLIPKLEPFSTTDTNIRVKLTFRKQQIEVREALDIKTLDIALQPKAFSKPTNIFKYLEDNWKIPITRVNSNGNNFPANPDISLIDGENYTFADIMDAIADSTMSDWDWSGRRAVIKQRS
jgi:hypothetical protein